MSRETLFVDVILPLSVSGEFTYRVPYEWNDSVGVGKRVVVQFGKSRLYTAIIHKVHKQAPQKYLAKYLVNVLDDRPVVLNDQLRFWEWMSRYYMCAIGEVFSAALPSGMKLASETKIVLADEHEKELPEAYSDKEFLLLDALEINHSVTIKEAQEILGVKNVFPVVKKLMGKGSVLLFEEVKQKYKPKTKTLVRLAEGFSEEAISSLLDKLIIKAPKQFELVMHFLKITRTKAGAVCEKNELIKSSGTSTTTLNSLLKKGVFLSVEEQVWREENANKAGEAKLLNAYQEKALKQIKLSFQDKYVCLLHGVTSSGKTEVYIQLIREYLDQGKQVLYLLPEIALTAQIIDRLKAVFGDKVGVYHSKYSDNERVEVWNRLMLDDDNTASYQVIIGARSAVFLPFKNLGLVIVDEEHDASYKQFDPSPRYNARDAAIYLAELHQARVLLGSATPSIESYFNAKQGKYAFAQMSKRYKDIKLPEILVANLREEKRKKTIKSHFTSVLMNEIDLAVKNKKQIILFQNRRGYVPVMECRSCGWTPQCTACDVTMTFHKYSSTFRCHYCGRTQKPESTCPACGGTDLKLIGFGTEKIEEELSLYYPNLKIGRMDLDTTRTKNAYHKLINSFETGELDVLVGTQMVTKGLDFDNVSLVGILNAESLTAYPDFRSDERGFQMMTQVSGRSGRKDQRGKVVIQAYDPGQKILQYVIENNYKAFFDAQLTEREEFKYPPFYRLIELSVKHKQHQTADAAAEFLGVELKRIFGSRLLGPNIPPVARIKNMYIRKLILKLERKASLKVAKEHLEAILVNLKVQPEYRSVIVAIDVDPM